MALPSVVPGPKGASKPFVPNSGAGGGGGRGRIIQGGMPVGGTVGTATGPHPPATALTDEQQIAEWVKAAQLPEIQSIQAAEKAASDAAARNAETVKGYYLALAGIMGNAGADTRQGYSQAAGATAAFGKGFSDGLQHVQDQMGSEATNVLGVAGAPASQGAELSAAQGGAGAADALYATGGYIPASTLEREGAAFGAAADRMPGASAYMGAQQIKQIMDAQNVTDQGYKQKLIDLAAQVPGLSLQYGQTLASQHAAAKAAELTAQYRQDTLNQRTKEAAVKQGDINRQFALTRWLETSDKSPANRARIAAQTGIDPVTQQWTLQGRTKFASTYGYDPVTLKPTLAGQRRTDAISKFNATQRSNGAKIDTAASTQAGYWVNNKGDPIMIGGNLKLMPGAKLNPDGTVTPAPKSGGPKLPSPKDVTKLVQQFYGGATTSVRTPVPKIDPKTGKPMKNKDGSLIYERDVNNNIVFTTTKNTSGGIDYFQGLRKLKAMGLSDVQARTYLNAAYKRGERGRGWLTNEEQGALYRAKLKPAVSYITINGKRHAYITAKQYGTLQKAGVAPAGEASLIKGKPVFYIRPGY